MLSVKNMKNSLSILSLVVSLLACSETKKPDTKMSANLVEPAEQTEDYTSKVPMYTFATTLEEQEEQLKTNPLLLRFYESRKKLSSDPYRPIYHYVNPEGPLNDPNGLCFWQGRWHLFYQAYPPEDPGSTGAMPLATT